MYGSSTYVMQPMMFVGISPPSYKFGANFYNPGKVNSSFISEFGKKVLPFVNENVENTLNMTDEQFDEMFGPIKKAQVEELGQMQSFLSALNAADGAFKEVLDNKDNSEFWKASGYRDSLAILTIIKNFESPDMAKTEKVKYKETIAMSLSVIEALLGADEVDERVVRDELKALNDLYGSLIETINPDRAKVFKGDSDDLIGDAKKFTKWLKEDFVNELSDLIDSYQLNNEKKQALQKLEDYLEIKSVEPAIGMVGVNIVGRAMSNAQETAAKAIEKRADEIEKAQTRQERKRLSENKKMRNESIKEANQRKKANMKKEGKNNGNI